jgi:hypothetical protein
VLEARGGEAVAAPALAHFWLVAAAALAGAIASAALTAAGVRRNDGRTVLLGTAFSTMTAMLAVHGLATPGVLAGPNGVIGFAGGASLPSGAFVLALSALPALRRPRRIRVLVGVQLAIAAGIVALGASRCRRSCPPCRGRAAPPPSRCSPSASACSRCSPRVPCARGSSRAGPRTCSSSSGSRGSGSRSPRR